VDHLRQVRFVLAPMVFLASILLAAFEGGHLSWKYIFSLDGSQLVAIGGVVLAFTLPVGFLIGAITQAGMHRYFMCRWGETFDASFKPEQWPHVWKASKTPEDMRTNANKLYATVVLELGDEEKNRGIIGWIDRRWNACHASMNAILAAIFSWIVFPPLGLEAGPFWWVAFAVLTLVCAHQAWRTWHEVMGLIAFRAELNAKSA